MNLPRALFISLVLHLALLLALLPTGHGGPGSRNTETFRQIPSRIELSMTERTGNPSPAKTHTPPAPLPVSAPEPASAAVAKDGDGKEEALPYYYPTSELTHRANLATQLDMSFLETAQGQGKAIVTLLINEGGSIDQVHIEASDLPPELENYLRQQFGSAHFHPAEREGLQVKSRMRIEVFIGPLQEPPPQPPPAKAMPQNQ